MINQNCKTKYPIVLIHGCGFRDYKKINYWGRIPKVLSDNGAEVYYGHQDSWATIEDNAQRIKQSVLEILKKTGAEKVNLIAHSKGGLDCRYMISKLGMADMIASLTTISTPHHGSKTVEILYNTFPKFAFKFVGIFVNGFNRIVGDKKPNFVDTCEQFTSTYSEKFNISNSDSEKVFYQSYATVMRNSLSDLIMLIPHFIVSKIDGECDGLVSAKSAKWTNFRGVIKSANQRGISHCDSVDIRRRKLNKKQTDINISDKNIADITQLYFRIVHSLVEYGF